METQKYTTWFIGQKFEKWSLLRERLVSNFTCDLWREKTVTAALPLGFSVPAADLSLLWLVVEISAWAHWFIFNCSNYEALNRLRGKEITTAGTYHRLVFWQRQIFEAVVCLPRAYHFLSVPAFLRYSNFYIIFCIFTFLHVSSTLLQFPKVFTVFIYFVVSRCGAVCVVKGVRSL